MSRKTESHPDEKVEKPSNRALRVLSGIKPTGDSLHLGNYFGALRQFVELQ